MRRNMSAILLLIGSLLVLGLCVAAALRVWNGLEGVEMAESGYLGAAIGTVATILLGIGLMALLFYSARRGYDERVGDRTAADDEPGQGAEKP